MRGEHQEPTTPVIPAARADADGEVEAEQLLRTAAAGGDQNAFALLYQKHRGTVYRYLLRRINGDPYLAEDLTHETFVKALARIGSYRDMGRPFVAWLLTIAGNLVADHYKSGWRRLQVPQGDIGGGAESDAHDLVWAEDRDDIAAVVVGTEYRRYVREILVHAMDDLTAWQQQVMQLRYVEGLSVRDTAVKLDTQEGAVKAATYRAVRVLARNPRLRRLRADVTG